MSNKKTDMAILSYRWMGRRECNLNRPTPPGVRRSDAGDRPGVGLATTVASLPKDQRSDFPFRKLATDSWVRCVGSGINRIAIYGHPIPLLPSTSGERAGRDPGPHLSQHGGDAARWMPLEAMAGQFTARTVPMLYRSTYFVPLFGILSLCEICKLQILRSLA